MTKLRLIIFSFGVFLLGDASAFAQKNTAPQIVLQSGHNGFDRGWISAVQFSPDGRWLASAIGGDFAGGGQVLIWNAQKRIWAREDSLPPVQTLDWSADSRFLAIGDDKGAKIWSREKTKIVAATTWDDNDANTFDGVSKVKFLSGNRIAVLQGESSDKSYMGKKSYVTLRTWNWKSGAQTVLKTLSFASRDITLYVSPNRETLALASADGVELFSGANGKSQLIQQQIVLPKTQESGLFSPRILVFSPNSKLVAGFQYLSSTYAVFNVETAALKNIGQTAGSFRPHAYNIDNGGNISWMMRQESENDKTFLLENYQSDKLISRVKSAAFDLGADYQTFADSQSQQFVVAGNGQSNGDLFWFDAKTALQTHVSRAAKQWANAIAFSTDGARLAVGYGTDSSRGITAELAIFNSRNGIFVRDATADGGIDTIGSGVNDVLFSPDGKYLLTTCDIGYDKTGIRVLDAKSLRVLRDVALPGGGLSEMAFSRDGKSFVIGTHEDKVLFWKDFQRAFAGQKPNWTFAKPQKTIPYDAMVYALEISPDQKTVLATFDRGPTVFLNAQNGVLLHQWNDGLTVGGTVFSANGQTLWTGNEKGEIKEWNAKTYALRRVLQKTGDSCNAMALSHDQAHLYVALGKSIVAFNVKSGRQEIVFDSAPQQINAIAVATDGRIASADEFGTARIYDAKTGKCTHIFNRTSWSRDRKGLLTTRTITQMPNGKVVISPGNKNAVLQRDGNLMKPIS